jgi:hypothetical protein
MCIPLTVYKKGLKTMLESLVRNFRWNIFSLPLLLFPVFSYGSKEEKENFRQKGKQTKTGKRHQRTGVSHWNFEFSTCTCLIFHPIFIHIFDEIWHILKIYIINFVHLWFGCVVFLWIEFKRTSGSIPVNFLYHLWFWG